MTDPALLQDYAGVFAGALPLGRRPAVLVIDFIRAYVTPGAPLFSSPVVAAVARTPPLLAAARAAGVPVIYTRVLYHPNGLDGGLFVRKIPALRAMVPGEPMAEIVPDLPPATDDLVITKQYASAFFGTHLAPTLMAQGIDTLVIAGCSTSGCVRATAVDAIQHGVLPVVVRDCVGDRRAEPHDANLFDIQAKYGEVLERDVVIAYLSRLRA